MGQVSRWPRHPGPRSVEPSSVGDRRQCLVASDPSRVRQWSKGGKIHSQACAFELRVDALVRCILILPRRTLPARSSAKRGVGQSPAPSAGLNASARGLICALACPFATALVLPHGRLGHGRRRWAKAHSRHPGGVCSRHRHSVDAIASKVALVGLLTFRAAPRSDAPDATARAALSRLLPQTPPRANAPPIRRR